MRYKVLFAVDLLFFPVVSWGFCVFYVFAGKEAVSRQYLYLGMGTSIVILLSFAIFLTALKKVAASVALSREVKALEQHAEVKKQQDKEMEALRKDAKEKQDHFIAQLHTLQDALRAKEYGAARSEIHTIIDASEKSQKKTYCSDFFINTILQIKMREAQQKKIRTQCRVALPPLRQSSSLSCLELSSLFFNLLDNGIESCVQSGQEEPFLNIEIACREKMIRIHMENSKNDRIQFDGNTTKEQKESHGFGLKIIEEIVNAHEGFCQWTDKGKLFDSVLLINDTKR